MPNVLKTLSFRSTWLKIHRFLALLVGFFFAVLGLTGSLSIYRTELDSFLNPQLHLQPSQQPIQSLDHIINAIKAAHPNRYGSWTLEMPQSAEGMITAWLEKPQESIFDFHAPLMVSVNPYTAEVVDNRFWGKTFTTWVLDWHTHLHLGEFGWKVVGCLGALLLISVGSGLYLWWPGLLRLPNSFTIHLNAGQKTLLFDLHKNLGLFSSLMLIILSITGINLSYPQLLQSITGATGMAHGDTGREIVSTADPTKNPTSLAGAVFIARSAFPKAVLRRISTPLGETGVYRINFRQSSEINQRHPYTTVWVDQWSGQIKAIRDPLGFSSGEKISTWIWPVHTGEAWGESYRFLWFLSGIALFFLYISGISLWLFRQGILQDKAVDFTPLKRTCYRSMQYVQRKTISLADQIALYLPTLKSQLQSLIAFISSYYNQSNTHNTWQQINRYLSKIRQHSPDQKK